MIIPLAERLRPSLLEEIVGQDHLLGSDGLPGCNNGKLTCPWD